jgi:excisionase family DNA binding protein
MHNSDSERIVAADRETTGGAVAPNNNSVLDVDDIARLFKCSREKVKRMARAGELPAFKLGKCWYVRRNDLERFLAHKVESSCHLCRIQEVSP